MKKQIVLQLDDKKNYYTREAFNTLRTNILFSGRDVKTIVLTSCLAHEGKSTVSFELAVSLTEAGKKVLFVDADLRKSICMSRLTKETGLSGLSQYLSGQEELDNVLYGTQVKGLDVIFAGPFPPNPTELVGSDAFATFLKENRDRYDYILVDSPPLGLVVDAALIAAVCDGSVIVLDSGAAKVRAAQRVLEQLRRSNPRVLGAVLNQTRRKKGRGGKSAYGSYYAYNADGKN